MNRTLKRAGLWLAATALAVGTLAAATPGATTSTNSTTPKKPSDLFANVIVAKGKGVEVKQSQLDDALVSLKSSMAAQNQSVPSDQMALFEQNVLDRLIQLQLLLAKATDADKTRGKEDCAKRYDDIKTRAGSEENLARQLKAMGLTPEDLRGKMADEATAQAVLERELNVTVTPGNIENFYTNNPAKFEQPEMVRASHILLSTKDPADTTSNPALRRDLSEAKKAEKRKLAEDLLKRARAGEDFAKLAKEYSDDPGSKDKGGEYTFGRGQMVPEFEAVAFTLKTNEVSNIVITTYGYHIIKLSEKIPAKTVDLAKVSSRIKDYLTQQDISKKAPPYFAQLKKDAAVEILDERLKPKETLDAAPAPMGGK